MTYNPGIPNPTDLISNSQSAIKTNFTQLNTIFDEDHYKWNDAETANRGLHRKVSIADVDAPGAQVNPASIIYTKSVTGVISPYFKNAVGDSVIWRGGSSNGLASSTLNGPFTSGSFVFPNGVIMKWGYATNKTDGSNINMNAVSPAFAACSMVQVTGIANTDDDESLWVSNYTASNITVRTSFGSVNVQWFAIGN